MTWLEAKPIVESIPGFLVPGQEEWLFNKAKSLPEYASVLEIGCWKGRSTAAVAFGLLNVKGRFGVIDINTDMAKETLEAAGFCVMTVFNFNQGDSVDLMRKAKAESIDLIFIDGSHRFSTVLCDVALSYRALKQGGWLVMHDVGCDFPDVTRVWEMIAPLLSDHEECSTIRAGRKTYQEHETP